MLGTEERLFDEYKRVDNICRDMFLGQSGISQYITEMEQNSSYGGAKVPLWDRDYRRLKHVRWLRNQIAHESFVTDCNEEDVAWLEGFHSRLLKQQDPLALLRKENRERSSTSFRYEGRPKNVPEQRKGGNAQPQRKEASSSKRMAIVFIWIVIALVGVTVASAFLINNI